MIVFCRLLDSSHSSQAPLHEKAQQLLQILANGKVSINTRHAVPFILFLIPENVNTTSRSVAAKLSPAVNTPIATFPVPVVAASRTAVMSKAAVATASVLTPSHAAASPIVSTAAVLPTPASKQATSVVQAASAPQASPMSLALPGAENLAHESLFSEVGVTLLEYWAHTLEEVSSPLPKV